MRHFRSATEFPNPELQTLTPIIRQLGNQNWTTSVEGVTPSYLATADLRIALPFLIPISHLVPLLEFNR
jgi:hypothetical protein